MPSSSPDSAGPEPAAAAAGMCAEHPNLRAAFVCGACGLPICTLCAFTRNDGSRICAACASSAAVIQSDGPRVIGQGYAAPENVRLLKCIQHPKVAAARVCRVCGAPMCATCDFSLPSGLHLCPQCVVAPPKRIARSRKVLVIMAYALAVWGTVALAGFTSGALGALLKTKPDRATVGIVYAVFIFFPAVIGAAMGISSFDKRLSNTAWVWAAAIWNGLLLGIHVLLIILGHLMA